MLRAALPVLLSFVLTGCGDKDDTGEATEADADAELYAEEDIKAMLDLAGFPVNLAGLTGFVGYWAFSKCPLGGAPEPEVYTLQGGCTDEHGIVVTGSATAHVTA